MNLKKLDRIEAMGYDCRISDLEGELMERMDQNQIKLFDYYLEMQQKK